MKELNMKGDDLLKIGFPEGKVIGVALGVLGAHADMITKKEMKFKLAQVLARPEDFIADEVYGPIATELIAQLAIAAEACIEIKEDAPEYAVFGADNIEPGAREQMNVAMRLPVTLAGALMPDAHQGYGLPIGGVLATNNAIIPYGVGVDIGCRMALTVFDISANYFEANQAQFKRDLIAYTKFGAGRSWEGAEKAEHAVLDNAAFNMTPMVKHLKDKAYAQLGTSGGGNHFVEWGIIEFDTDDEKLNVKKGKYLALLSHSGSRGFGATIAGHYTKLAKELCKLPKEAANLAYLDMNSEAGQEYWMAMNLAGDYASACHEVIHQRLVKAVGGNVLAKVENHHNFAWKETWNGQEVLVHRKGATPAGKDVMGIIPGSMTAPGFLVRGKGLEEAINSASHGAGRKMSRTKALSFVTKSDMKAVLKDHGVTLIGAGRDEAPMAYKDIHAVMAAQTELVDVVAKFTPKMVRMADDGSRED